MNRFSKQTFAFLMENRMQDSREWYHEHKQDFTDYVLEPLQQLVTELTPTLLSIDDKLITEPRTDKAISRVYRDTRFSKDKMLYRENMWCVFMRDKKLYHGPPAFFFELSPGWLRWGCGYYQASGPEMEAMRQLILENNNAFAAAKKAFEVQDPFAMEGDSYKRSRHPDAPEELQTWLNRKNLSFIHTTTDFDILFSDKLAATLAKDFLLLKPMYDFFLAAHSRAPRA